MDRKDRAKISSVHGVWTVMFGVPFSTCAFAGPQNACQSLHVGTLLRVDTRPRAHIGMLMRVITRNRAYDK